MEIDMICNTNQKKAGVSISGKAYFSAKYIIWDKECDLIIIKGSLHQQDIRILNVYASSNKASEYIQKKSDRPAGRTKQIHSYNQSSQQPFINN